MCVINQYLQSLPVFVPVCARVYPCSNDIFSFLLCFLCVCGRACVCLCAEKSTHTLHTASHTPTPGHTHPLLCAPKHPISAVYTHPQRNTCDATTPRWQGRDRRAATHHDTTTTNAATTPRWPSTASDSPGTRRDATTRNRPALAIQAALANRAHRIDQARRDTVWLRRIMRIMC